jgi:S-adenosylmethionine:tRNA ribosyltransferase-isomerase
MVSSGAGRSVVHATFRELPRYLQPGDVLVVNRSATRNAALDAVRADGTLLELHLSTHLPADLWAVELRRPSGAATKPFLEARAGEVLALPRGARVTLHAPYRGDRTSDTGEPGSVRLWVASLHLGRDVDDYLWDHGFPIRYGYVRRRWPASYYQTLFADTMGSAEMPSAGRAFTPRVVAGLERRGVSIARLLLHTGVASLESHEPPYEEWYDVPLETARLVNAARAEGRRIVAVGTTAVRALESVADEEGVVHPGRGWTDLIVTPERGLRVVNALLTGLHEPRSTHLQMLEALAGREHLARAYAQALEHGYLWHEFGDLHLILRR